MKPQPDSRFQSTLIETRRGLRAVRDLRAALLELATSVLEAGEQVCGVLLLDHPGVSPDRLRQEWTSAREAFRKDLADRIFVAVLDESGLWTIPDPPSHELRDYLVSLAGREPGSGAPLLPERDTRHEILKLLLLDWAAGDGPTTLARIREMVGCSYPPVADTLRELGGEIRRQADRRVVFLGFPQAAWSRLVALAPRARATMRFVDRSGRPRPAEFLLERLHGLDRDDLAIGGVDGARRHDPELDLVGNPRVDITVHSVGRSPDLAFIRRLDPALELTHDPSPPARLVLHFLRRREPLFRESPDGGRVADPVECLLDLEEAGYEALAKEFLAFLHCHQDPAR